MGERTVWVTMCDGRLISCWETKEQALLHMSAEVENSMHNEAKVVRNEFRGGYITAVVSWPATQRWAVTSFMVREV